MSLQKYYCAFLDGFAILIFTNMLKETCSNYTMKGYFC